MKTVHYKNQQTIYVWTDPATGMFWNGDIPGEFSHDWNLAGRYLSESQAKHAFAEYIKYTTSRVTNPSPAVLNLETHVITFERTTSKDIGPSNYPAPFLMGVASLVMRKRSDAVTITGVIREIVKMRRPLYAIAKFKKGGMHQADVLAVAPTAMFPSNNWGTYVPVENMVDVLAIKAAFENVDVIDLQPVLVMTKELYGCEWNP